MALATLDGSGADDGMRHLVSNDSGGSDGNPISMGKEDGDDRDDVDNVKRLLLATTDDVSYY
jgi:hypothetical protein